jgi:excisionase family DNA binding protein
MPAEQLRQLIADAVTLGVRRATQDAPPAAESVSDLPEMITRKEAAKILGVSTATISRYQKDGMLQKHKVGFHHVRLRRSEVEKMSRLVP